MGHAYEFPNVVPVGAVLELIAFEMQALMHKGHEHGSICIVVDPWVLECIRVWVQEYGGGRALTNMVPGETTDEPFVLRVKV